MSQQPPNVDYWQIYHAQDLLRRADTLRSTDSILSTSVRLNIDIYPQTDKDAPAFLFNHGGGGYSRLFIPIALGLYDLGYTVVLPDQRGQGLSDGDRGDYTVTQLTQNIVDAARWARGQFKGNLFMGGASVGGGLTYYAAASGAPVDAMILHNLFDFGNTSDGLALSRTAALSAIPGVAPLTRLSVGLIKTLAPSLKLPYHWFGVFEKMVDERAVGFYDQWKDDPYPTRSVSIRFLDSTLTTPPAIPLEQNTIPALVINQTRDRMVSPSVTKRNYERLGGDKQYIEIDYGHWAIGDTFVNEWVTLVDRFLRRYIRR